MNEAQKNNHYRSNEKHLPRINRTAGQINGIKKMIEDRRYCVDILTQLKAARSSLYSLEMEILKDHISHCVNETFASNDHNEKTQKIEEILQILKRFED